MAAIPSPTGAETTEPNMTAPLTLGKYSFGIGDRFAHQARAQLRACMLAAENGATVVPVWNKSLPRAYHRRLRAGERPDRRRCRGAGPGLEPPVPRRRRPHPARDGGPVHPPFRLLHARRRRPDRAAGRSGGGARDSSTRHHELIGEIAIPGIEQPIESPRAEVERVAAKYLAAVLAAGKIYRHIAKAKGAEHFITEVSMDETDLPQTPPELLIILAALADEAIPLQTIAPKFTGRFNKGVDYVGDLAQFEKEFNDDVCRPRLRHPALRVAARPEAQRSFGQR